MKALIKSVVLSTLLLSLADCTTTTTSMTGKPNATDIVFIDIGASGDSFTMGDGIIDSPIPESFSYNFRISKYEITNAQFSQFVQEGGYHKKEFWTTNGWEYRTVSDWNEPLGWPDQLNYPNRPAGSMSWYEAVAFCNWLSAKESLAPAYDKAGKVSLKSTGYRLPTEAEWEYTAAKGGKGLPERIFPYGNTWDINKDVADTAALKHPNDVGSKSSAGGDTPQGVADMGGNVREWCSDNWQEQVISSTDRYVFSSDSPDKYFSIRGGAHHESSEDAFRNAKHWQRNFPIDRGGDFGFRVVSR